MFGAREPASTIKFVDDYCQWYRKLFPEVRSFEALKYLHVGIISDIKGKTLPAIARVVGLSNEQRLLHFLTESPWKLEQLSPTRLKLIL
jgi:SRSO17 transposase